MNPKVTVVIPAYNAEAYIAAAITSVLEQTYPNIELIVVNDGSSDGTEHIVKSFGENVRYIVHENKGLPAARNTGIAHSSGEYISFLDADDMYLAEKIEQQVRFLQQHPEYTVAYCHMYHFYDNAPTTLYRHTAVCPSGNVLDTLLDRFFGQADTLCIPRHVFDTVGVFNEAYRFGEDWELNIRIAKAGYTFGFINIPLIKMRITKNSWSSLQNQVGNKESHVRIFESLLLSTSLSKKESDHVKNSLRNMQFQLGIAHMLRGEKKESLAILAHIHPLSFVRKIIVYMITLLPIAVSQPLLRAAWRRNRRNLLQKVSI